MLSKNRKVTLVCVLCLCFTALIVTGNANADDIADINFTETEIIIIPNMALLNVSIKFYAPTGHIVFQKEESSGNETINISEFSSTHDGQYRIWLYGDTGETVENIGRPEDGRENKIYVLKKMVEQSTEFTLSGAKILSAEIIEE